MFVVRSKDWPPAQVVGQERLLIELWLEALASDTTPPYWPAICSTLQTLKNLLTTLEEVERQMLREYHVRDSIEETLTRLKDCSWLNEHYAEDLTVLRDVLARSRDIHTEEKDKKTSNQTDKLSTKLAEIEEPTANSADRARKMSQEAARRTAASFLKAFLARLDHHDLIKKQVTLVRKLTEDSDTRFEVLSRAVGELVNDLVHRGHSRNYLHGWMLGTVLKTPEPRPPVLSPILDRFQKASDLGQRLEKGCEVLFMVSATSEVPDTEVIHFHNRVPSAEHFPLISTSPFLTTRKRFALVTVSDALDRQAAADHAHRHLTRYFHSTRLDHIRFNRDISDRAAVRIVSTGSTQEVNIGAGLSESDLHNDKYFYNMSTTERNQGTFAELDRVLYWLEQSRRWEDVGRLIALWTALEFLFSKSTRPAAESIQDFVPAYLVPNYARELLIDFWAHIEHVPEFSLTEELKTRLQVEQQQTGKRRKVNLTKLFELCLEEPNETNALRTLIKPYSILLRKLERIRQLKQTPKTDMPLHRALSRFEREIIHDLRFAFRARNTVVHDAAIQIVQIDRLIQRLNWILCTAIDTLLYQFVHNPSLSLIELHEINKTNFTRWKRQIQESKTPIPVAELIEPPHYCLAGGER